jgi:two-component system CheB/CheR fusion protein
MATKKKASRRQRSGRSAAKSGRSKQVKNQPAAIRRAADLSTPKTRPAASTADVRRDGFAVVGIGASAGGLDAFKQFFAAMPADSGLAFVLIQHLDPTHTSLTAELVDKHTAMTVVEAGDGMRIEPNRVYVIAPNCYLTVSGQTLHLTEPVKIRGVRVPIDFFFRSLADDQQNRAIAIILTGTGSDGTLGAREIKAAGGLVLVQSPESAEHGGMPRSAINADVADRVLAIREMPAVLLGYVKHWYVNGGGATQREPETVSDDLTAILGMLRARIKYDFSGYKKGTLTRRIQRRMGLSHIADMTTYIERLRQDRAEFNSLYKDLLIGVTNFFREPEAWAELEQFVIDPLIAAQPYDAPLRVWVPGCATGEEAYSLAMLLLDRMQAADKSCGIQIFASDIDQDALSFARAAVYPESIAADVSSDRLGQFFVKGEHTFRINKEVREAVVFAEQNLISDPPFSKLDLVSCRNLLIYLEPEVQKAILSVVHFALRDQGFLFLGGSETVSQQPELFEPLSRKWRIYRRTESVRRRQPDLILRKPPALELAPEARPLDDQRRIGRLSSRVQAAIIKRYAPACVVVNYKLDVLYLHGPVDKYLQLPSGELAANLIEMSRPGLRTKLRAIINQAIEQDKPVTVAGVRIKRDEQYYSVRVVAEPLREFGEIDGVLLVAFDEANAADRVRIIYVEPHDARKSDRPESIDEFETVIRQLEEELRATREDLQTTIEELETANEEFKAANEEVLSINEELQSTNEELETSKEELQSVNEELQTVNSQLEQKVTEQEAMTNDVINLLASADIATIFLDRGFRLRRFTPAATRLLRVIESDVGRPIRDFARNFTDERLLADAEKVLERLTTIELEVQDYQKRWYLRRILPYRTADDRIDGVVITFTDVTPQKLLEATLHGRTHELEDQVASGAADLRIATAALLSSEGHYRALLESAPDAIIVADQHGAILHVNRRTEQLVGSGRDALVGQPMEELLPEQFRDRLRRQRAEFLRDPQARPTAIGVQCASLVRDGRELPVEIRLSPAEIDGHLVVIAAVRDVAE